MSSLQVLVDDELQTFLPVSLLQDEIFVRGFSSLTFNKDAQTDTKKLR